MGYELKHIVAICLIVKLAAFSTEFSVRPQTERLNQGSDTVKSLQKGSLTGVEKPWVTQMDEKSQAVHFNLEPGAAKFNDIRRMNKKYIMKSERVKINPAFDTCEHMMELLETSKWKDIQKTLHRLNRALASSSNNLRSCRRKSGNRKPNFRLLDKKLSFYSPIISSKNKNYFQMKNFSDRLIMNCRKNLRNSLTPHNDSEQRERLKSKCEHKYKFKRLYQKKSRRKTKNRKYFRKKIVEEHRHYSERPVRVSNITMKSKNVFPDSEKLYYNEKKNEMETSGGKKFGNRKSDFENTVKIYNDLEKKLENLEQIGNQGLANKEKTPGKWPVSLELRKSDGKNYKKENPWPNFIYHRVSSDLFNLGSTASNHKQSAYVAISVNTSGVPETVKNQKKNWTMNISSNKKVNT